MLKYDVKSLKLSNFHINKYYWLIDFNINTALNVYLHCYTDALYEYFYVTFWPNLLIFSKTFPFVGRAIYKCIVKYLSLTNGSLITARSLISQQRKQFT